MNDRPFDSSADSKTDPLSVWSKVYDGFSDKEIEEIEQFILQRGGTKPVLVALEQTCEFAPAQWEGSTANNCPVYIRGRHGFLSARMGRAGESIDDDVHGKEIVRIEHEEADGISSLEMVCLLSNTFDFSRLKEIGNRTES